MSTAEEEVEEEEEDDEEEEVLDSAKPAELHEDSDDVYPLTKEMISQRLSLLCRTGNGLAHAFVKVDLQDRKLGDIAALSSYIHLRYVDISNNQITDLSPLACLTQLLWLKVDNNAVTSFNGQPFGHLRYLQWLSIAMNLLTELDGLIAPSLETIILTGNAIHVLKVMQSVCFTNLVTLELRRNRLDTIEEVNLPNLRHLFLAENKIKSLVGLEKLERLVTLHLRDNEIDNMDGLSANMKCLQYLNVRGNRIYEEHSLESLKFVSKSLRVLVMSENPLEDTTDYRICILTLLPKLERIDKYPVSQEERADALTRIRDLEEISS